MRERRTRRWWIIPLLVLAATMLAPAAGADDHGQQVALERPEDPELLDGSEGEATSAYTGRTRYMAVTDRSGGGLELIGRGKRLVRDATTDVWAHDDFAYTGTFNDPCGGTSRDAGVWVWDVDDADDPEKRRVIPSPDGSRSNDVKVAKMNSGDILVHSNESCAGGPGGFEIYDVDNPKRPRHLASVRIDELNPISDALFGGITDVGTHNLWLFTQGGNDDDGDDDDGDDDDNGNRNGGRDYVAVVAETAFDNFMIFDITDPRNPTLAAAWGAEEIFDPGVGDETTDVDRVLDAALWLLDGFGASANRFLHDITVSDDGTRAYLSNWDAGLVLMDISDPTDPQLVSVALDPANGSLDGEVNSHAAWPSEDGKVVVETEEDFDAWQASAPPSNLTLDSVFPGDPTIPGTAAATPTGDDFEANQTGNIGTVDGSSIKVTSGPLAGNTYDAIELETAAGSPTFADTGPLTGELVWIGQACPDGTPPFGVPGGDTILNADAIDPGDIAVVRRGACFFEAKAAVAATLGVSAMVLANNTTVEDPWGGVRIWDYSDPANPRLASTYFTECSASPTLIEGCSGLGTYSVHNVIVEDDKAYISWYWDGMLVLDISDPEHPREIASFFDDSPRFIRRNGGNPHDFWGVDKIPGKDEIYASDRNGGLYIFELDDDDDRDDDEDDEDKDDEDKDDEDKDEDDDD